MQSTTVPTNLTNLRVDIVGSFLRPDALKQAFDAFDTGELTPGGLQRAQDEAVAELVRTEDQHGLPIVSDGEFRRQQFMQSFTDVGGMELWLGETLQRERARKGAEVTALTKESGTEVQRPVTQRLELRRNQILDEYRAVAALTATPAKVTLIGPDRLAQRYDEQASRAVYPAVDDFVADVVRVQCEMVGQVRDAGCRYVSIDAPGYTAYVDESTLGLMRSRGQDPQRNLERSIRADNAIVEAFPDLTFGIHLCRGNARSQWHRSGAYDAIAEQLFESAQSTQAAARTLAQSPSHLGRPNVRKERKKQGKQQLD